MKGLISTRVFQLGGLVAAVVLIAFGIVAIVMGVNGRNTVQSNLAAEKIYFGDAATDEAVPAKYSGKLVDTGTEARAFADVMRHHTLAGSGGLTYAQMGRFTAKPDAPKQFTDGAGGTSDEKYALLDEKGSPVANAARNTWVTETALTTALNLAYTAEQVSLFGIVVGVALLLSGIGFAVLALAGAIQRVPWPSRAAAAKPAAGGPAL
jgi:hypothetical protein